MNHVSQRGRRSGATGLPTLLVLCFLWLPWSLLAVDPAFTVDTLNVTFDTPTALTLDAGASEIGAATNDYALLITVDGGDTGKGWSLHIKAANSLFLPGVMAKGCEDVRWKQDGDGANAYRLLTTTESLVEARPGGGPAIIRLDLRMLVDWSDPPAAYSLDMTISMTVDD